MRNRYKILAEKSKGRSHRWKKYMKISDKKVVKLGDWDELTQHTFQWHVLTKTLMKLWAPRGGGGFHRIYVYTYQLFKKDTAPWGSLL
jgi:hypothetical protein